MKEQQYNRRTVRPRRPHHQPRGAVLIAALVCLVVVMSIVGAMLKGALHARRQLHVQRDLRQTEFLLQAGADRAAFRLRHDPEYRGETWDIPAQQIVGAGDGRVAIEAVRDANDQPWQVSVLAEYPLNSFDSTGELSIRRSRKFLVHPLQE